MRIGQHQEEVSWEIGKLERVALFKIIQVVAVVAVVAWSYGKAVPQVVDCVVGVEENNIASQKWLRRSIFFCAGGFSIVTPLPVPFLLRHEQKVFAPSRGYPNAQVYLGNFLKKKTPVYVMLSLNRPADSYSCVGRSVFTLNRLPSRIPVKIWPTDPSAGRPSGGWAAKANRPEQIPPNPEVSPRLRKSQQKTRPATTLAPPLSLTQSSSVCRKQIKTCSMSPLLKKNFNVSIT
ncbi:hypothetical protein FN846DRAFT_201162 [Sphaerosporella brunnea]|uniref:Uncharacterized protein n=1 Tax=Sphaerosporella brunnea TaxID=1250544 RepID=A0A5J5EPU8_9PEZI|nr:hypothetical protein FN846DRAFT_201162 [Sphaerosporella brunnea]